MSYWVLSAVELGFLPPKSCSLDNLEPVLKYLDKRIPYLDPYIKKNLELFRLPKKTFPDAKFAISLALPYYYKPLQNEGFSLYCQGKDYHKVINTLLQEYLLKLQKHYLGYSFQAFCDTGPILDRAVALASGLGYLGKNTSIIHPQAGSFVFLATVVTDLPLENGNFIGFCAQCNACKSACPTEAIMDSFLIDTNRCLSALTQKKGFLSFDLCQKISGHIFGCDICQTVCPHNANIPSSSIITPFYLLRNPDLNRLVAMDSEYRRLLLQSAASWRGVNIIRRNALISLAFSDLPLDADIIEKMAKSDPSHLIRTYAAFCLEKRVGKDLWNIALKDAPAEALAFYKSIKNAR